jgi:pyruvate dehydrogenase E2 component (dihydrolipoamide acetyltransferase)
LVAPVLREAHTLSVSELAAARRALTVRVQTWQHHSEDLAGGTFTVSHLGPLAVDHFTPIINPPQVAILGVGRLQRRDVAWWPEQEPEARWLLPVSLTFDHRVNDGADAARFLEGIQERLLDSSALVRPPKRGQAADQEKNDAIDE